MSEMPHPYPELANKMILTSSEDEYRNITYELLLKERFKIKTDIFLLCIIHHPLARAHMPEWNMTCKLRILLLHRSITARPM